MTRSYANKLNYLAGKMYTLLKTNIEHDYKFMRKNHRRHPIADALLFMPKIESENSFAAFSEANACLGGKLSISKKIGRVGGKWEVERENME